MRSLRIAILCASVLATAGLSVTMGGASSRPAYDLPSTGKKLRGILFDMDGTLTNSDDVHFEAYRATIKRLQPAYGEISRAFYDTEMSGMSNEVIVPKLFPDMPAEQQERLWLEKEEEYRRLTENGMAEVAGLTPLLSWCDAQGVKTIIVTNAPRLDAEHTTRQLGLHDRFFGDIVIGTECKEAKPSPEPYLEGLRRLGLEADECIAFEDSPAGAKSAVGASLRTVAVLSSRTESFMVEECGCAMGVRSFEDERLLSALRRDAA